MKDSGNPLTVPQPEPGRSSEGGDARDQAVAGRFAFGKNWGRFLEVLDDEHIAEAERSLVAMLGEGALDGRSFLDVGSGSGLFSLAAARLGAERIHSFDFDPESVACTAELRRRYGPGTADWAVERGDILDDRYVEELGQWDVVYAWGVLHHTGDLDRALANAERTVAPEGRLFISVYNDQGLRSGLWTWTKRTYNALPRALKPLFAFAVMFPREVLFLGWSVLKLDPLGYVRGWTEYKRSRGMSHWHDLIDWIGGYPFEVAKPEQVFDFYTSRGLTLERLKTCAGRLGCNEFVFRRQGP
jgi:2-polyprenyl-6-hydroxyphenyl methylase/3-demethylubiquinone-9 3-methyltransferase